VITDNLQRDYYISIRISCLHSDHHISNVLAAISYVALDTRLGCLEPKLAPDSEPQRIIDSVQRQFDCMYKMEMKLPIWKFVSTQTWRKYVKATDVFLE
jgi:cytochrome P450 family 49 subfamily A